MQLQAENLHSEGAVMSANEALNLIIEKDLNLGAAQSELDFSEYHHYKSGNALARRSKTTQTDKTRTEQHGSQLNGETITWIAKT